MQFASVIGQEQIKKQLLLQVEEGRIPHAQLFCGPEGCGKFATALAYASYLLCQNPSSDDCCGVCKGCAMTHALSHPDLHFIFPVVRKERKNGRTKDGDIFSTDYMKEWRKMLNDSVYFNLDVWMQYMDGGNQQPIINACESDMLVQKLALTSSQGGRKVIIIWMPERMNPTAANKLLKILEEPPKDTVFILVSNDPDIMLSTIISRTQRIEFPPLDDADIENTLQEQKGLSPQDARHVANYAQGNYVKALESLQVDMEADVFFEKFVSLMRLAYMRKVKDLYGWAEDLAGWGRERQKSFLQFCQRLIRENYIYNFNRPELNFMSVKESDFSKNFARFINDRNVIDITNELDKAIKDVSQNVNPKMIFFDFTLKMIMLLLK